ncbi:glycosyltransferase, group 1 family protein [delta proteobacterium NaphS2]|nr:glycosyltransferase, group 1 family protein [delta proteobacterium NaphS2]
MNRPRKKIFVVAPTESVLTKRGNRHPALALFLATYGYELEYVSSDFYHAEKRHFSAEEISRAKLDVPYSLVILHCLGYTKNISSRRVVSNILFSAKVFFYLWSRLNRKAILLLPSRPVEMIFAAAMLRLTRGTSVALDIQDIWPDMLIVKNRLKKLAFTIYCNMYLYSSLRSIDKFFHVAPSFVEWLHRYAPKARSIFIPLGFDEERWPIVASKQHASAKTPSRISLVCVAQLTFQFDVLPIVKAILNNELFMLTIIGEDGKSERYPEVINFIKEKAMKNVRIIGHVDRMVLVDHLVSADIGIVPMISTSLPNKVFDYIASNLPILALGQNDISDFVRQYDIGWCTSFDHKEIRSLLRTLTRGQILEKRKNVQKIRPNFSRDRLHQQLLKLIES